jgi:hypothetical protein
LAAVGRVRVRADVAERGAVEARAESEAAVAVRAEPEAAVEARADPEAARCMATRQAVPSEGRQPDRANASKTSLKDCTTHITSQRTSCMRV